MNVTEEKVDNLNAIIKIKLTPEDYTEQYDKKMAEARKQVTEPGFRPGKVPMGMIKKKYGQSILADELNKIINDKLYNHITENKLNLLGNTIPVSYTHLRAHETVLDLVCRLLIEKKKYFP